jgi:predicted XRE-type DNA-binding protein
MNKSSLSKAEKGGMNVYADLGMPDADEMLIKAQLATRIAQIIKKGKLTQIEAAQRLGMPQPRLSNMLRGRFRGISEAKMMDCLTRLGSDVEIVVKPAHRAKAAGHISVTFA